MYFLMNYSDEAIVNCIAKYTFVLIYVQKKIKMYEYALCRHSFLRGDYYHWLFYVMMYKPATG